MSKMVSTDKSWYQESREGPQCWGQMFLPQPLSIQSTMENPGDSVSGQLWTICGLPKNGQLVWGQCNNDKLWPLQRGESLDALSAKANQLDILK